MADRYNFNKDFNGIVEIGDGDFRASLLVQLCKDYDLGDKEYAYEVEQIAQWIDSPNDNVRKEVVFALCSLNPVPGYEYIAIKGWKSSPVSDLHWYASAIESSFTDSKQIQPDVVLAVVEKLWAISPVKDNFQDELDHINAMDDYQDILSDTMRVVVYFHKLLCPNSIVKDEAHDSDHRELDWRMVAEVLYTSMMNNQQIQINDRDNSGQPPII